MLCEPSPNALNQAVAPLDTPVTALSIAVTQTPHQSPSLHAQSINGNSSPTPPLVWTQGAIAAAPSYANATAGALYHGVARATSIILLSTPTHAPLVTQHLDATPVARPLGLSLGMGVGMFLFVAGSAMSGYDWLRARRMPSPSAPAQDELLDVLEGELLEEDSLEDD
jgi:hypothetical protein